MFTKIFTGLSKEVSRVAYVCTFFSHLIGPLKHCAYGRLFIKEAYSARKTRSISNLKNVMQLQFST